PPTLNALPNLTINENAPARNIALSGITSGSPSEVQPLSVSATSSDPVLIPSLSVIYSSPNSAGTLVFSTATYAYGTATVTVTVDDGQAQNNTTSRSFNVTVKPVNQPPTLSPISNITVSEDSGPSTVNLSGIS